jgi:hypothetical protein
MKLFNALMKALGYVPKPKLVKISYEEHLRNVPEHVIEHQVRTTLERARDFYAMRGRKILSVDLQTHLDFFDEAIGFDRLEHSPVLLPVNTDKN